MMLRFVSTLVTFTALFASCSDIEPKAATSAAESVRHASAAALEAALRTENTTSMVIMKGGETVFTYGPADSQSPTYVASVRKSILAMLMGEWVDNGTIDLDASLAELDIQDLEGLSSAEQQASVRNVISSRSGVYHPAANSSGLNEETPRRGAHYAGSYFWYNNWDFNVAGFVFESQTDASIFDDFLRQFAEPMELTSFDLNGHKEARENATTEGSRYAPYHFFLSTEDLAKLGQLMLQEGVWNGERLIPEEWIAETTSLVTPSASMNPSDLRNGEVGFGHMWWVFDPATSPDVFSDAFVAQGHFGQYILVLPQLDMVIAHKTAPHNYGDDIEYRDVAVDWSEFRHLVDLSIAAFADDLGLLQLLGSPAIAAVYDYCGSTTEERADSRLRTELSQQLGPRGRVNGAERAAAILIEAGLVVADTHPDEAACRAVMREGSELFEATFANHFAELEEQVAATNFSEGEAASVQRGIATGWVEDQSSRLAYVELLPPDQAGSSEYWAFERAKANAVFLDWQHRRMMEGFLERFEWIDHQKFGSDTAERSLTLIQHADADPSFQRMALDRMRSHLGPDGVSPSAYANLWDRVAVNSGELQRYGTQPQSECSAEDQLEPMPIEDIDGLPERRRAMGLEPLDEQMRRLSQERCS